MNLSDMSFKEKLQERDRLISLMPEKESEIRKIFRNHFIEMFSLDLLLAISPVLFFGLVGLFIYFMVWLFK